MISVGKATSAEYYTTGAGVQGGFESYYLDAVTGGEPAGFWSGRMAEALGLSGDVEARTMEQVYGKFEDPATGEPLGLRPQKWRSVDERLAAALAKEPNALPERVAQLRAQIERSSRTTVLGWDATFNVPKSVTVAHTALHRAEIAALRSGNTVRAEELGTVRRGIETAVLDANAAALSVLESLAVARTGGGSGTAQQWIAANQVTVASFFQHTNREVDPHLHVHNVVLNRAICADGKVRALDAEDLLAQKFAFSAVADRALFENLAQLGLDSVPRADGLGRELAAVPGEAVEHFSTRRARITAALAPLVEAAEEAKGRPLTDWETYQLKQTVTLSTRAAKDHTAWTHEELLQRWDATLVSEAGRTLDGLADAVMADVARGPVVGPALEDWSASAVVAEAVAACADRSATWGRANLISELELRLPILGIDSAEVTGFLEQLADTALASEHVVQVTGHTPDLDTGTAKLAATAPSARRYAATGTLAAEIALREAALARSGTALEPAAVAAWLDAHAPTIGDDQRAAILGLATSDAAVSVLVGPAGTGKSYTAGTLAAAWADLTRTSAGPAGPTGPDGPGDPSGPPVGGRVLGVAVSQIATTVLLDDGLPHAANVAAFLAAQERLDNGPTAGLESDQAWRLQASDIVLVDEASMVATKDLDAIRQRVTAAGARMVLAGDPRQLAAVQAGGALDVLDGHANTYTLSEVRRFDADWERAASLALRDAGTAPAGAGSAAAGDAGAALAEYDRRGRLLEHASLDDALAAAARAAVADRLDGRTTVVVTGSNEQAARTAMRIRDTLVELGHVKPDGVHLGRDGCTAGVGDVIACRRNDYALGVTNRQQYTVTAVNGDGSLIVAPLPSTASPTTGPGHGTGQDSAQGAAGDDAGPLPVGTLVELPAEYVAADVQLGYASTVHAAQGITVDTAHLVTDGALDPAGIYVALTRGRTRNTAHVAVTVDSTEHPDRGPLPEASTGRGGATVLTGSSTRGSASAVLAAAWDRTGRSDSAVVTAETDHARRASAATILSDLETQTRIACRARMESHLDDLVADGTLHPETRARLATDQASEHLSRLLRAVEEDGADPRVVLADALTAGITDNTPGMALSVDEHGGGRSDRRSRGSRAARATTARSTAADSSLTPTGESTGTAEAVRAAFNDAHSIAQVLSHRITAREVRASAGTEPGSDQPADALTELGATHVPAGIHPDDAARISALHAAFDDRGRLLGRQLAENPPRWVLLALGPVPSTDLSDERQRIDLSADEAQLEAGRALDPAADRADWERRAGLAAAHREAVGWDHPERALPGGPGVSAPERRASYAAAWTALGQPAGRLDETEMSEGRLRARVTAWQREQQWAPPHADDALRHASQAAERARQDAVLAEAEGREDDAAALRAEADTQAGLAETYERVSRARSAWAERTAATRINADNALEELTRRGITIGDEPDRRSTREHLDLNNDNDIDRHAADAAVETAVDQADVHAVREATEKARQQQLEDAHRTITDADVRDITAADDDWALTSAGDVVGELPVVGVEPAGLANEHAAETAAALDSAGIDDQLQAASRRPRRAGRPALDVVEPAADHVDSATLDALSETASAAVRIAADQASQDAAFEGRAAEDDAELIDAAGRGRRAAADRAAAASDADDWDRASTRSSDETAFVDDGHGNDARYEQRYEPDYRYDAADVGADSGQVLELGGDQ